MKKAIVIREKDNFRFMNTDDEYVNKTILELRSRLTGGDIQYYEMDLSEERLKGGEPMAFLQVLNLYPHIAGKSDMFTRI